MAEILDGETLIWKGRPIWRWSLTQIFRWSLIGILIIAIGVGAQMLLDVGLLWFVVAALGWELLVILVTWVRRLDTHYTVTSERIIVRRGIFSRNERSASLNRIQNVNTGQGIIGRILNFGDIEFDTAGSDLGDSDLTLRGVGDPHRLRDVLDAEVFARDSPSGI